MPTNDDQLRMTRAEWLAVKSETVTAEDVQRWLDKGVTPYFLEKLLDLTRMGVSRERMESIVEIVVAPPNREPMLGWRRKEGMVFEPIQLDVVRPTEPMRPRILSVEDNDE